VPAHKFGGGWTEQKLQILDDYLAAYCQIFRANPNARYFDTIYVDAFAGTGLIETQKAAADRAEVFAEFAEPEALEFLKGSASRALQHPFTRYVFIEKSAMQVTELEKLRAESPRSSQIFIEKGDANTHLARFVNLTDWKKCRAVVFLDP
jgi:three-Cys-motif partner protein